MTSSAIDFDNAREASVYLCCARTWVRAGGRAGVFVLWRSHAVSSTTNTRPYSVVQQKKHPARPGQPEKEKQRNSSHNQPRIKIDLYLVIRASVSHLMISL